eukprot:3026512-Amphidinium_carterae.3
MHEGVLYWMSLDKVKNLARRARANNDPEAMKEYEGYTTEESKLEMTLRQAYESANGRIEDVEEFKTALAAEDSDTLRTLVYQYARDIRARKAQWREAKIIEDDKKKEKYRQDFLQEQADEVEKQNKKRQREQGNRVKNAMTFNPNKITGPKPKRPPKPARAVPIPARDQVPATPGGELQQLSPRLRLDPKKFKNDRVPKEDSYYEKKMFEELRQRNYLTKHPTSQYHKSTEEIKKVYDGFEKQDYVETTRKRRAEVQAQQRGEEEVKMHQHYYIATETTYHEFATSSRRSLHKDEMISENRIGKKPKYSKENKNYETQNYSSSTRLYHRTL